MVITAPPAPLPPTLCSLCLEHPESGWLVLKCNGSIMYLFKNAHSSLKSQVEEEMAFWYAIPLLIPASLYSEIALFFCYCRSLFLLVTHSLKHWANNFLWDPEDVLMNISKFLVPKELAFRQIIYFIRGSRNNFSH